MFQRNDAISKNWNNYSKYETARVLSSEKIYLNAEQLQLAIDLLS